MNKLTLHDIKIKSPGKQVKKIILDQFGSIDDFAKHIKMETTTINQYLKEKKLGSATFKIRLSKALDKGLNEIVKSERDQINEMVRNAYENITLYNNNDDIEILLHIKELCIKNNMSIAISKMQRSIAMHYFYCNQINKATSLIESAMDAVKNPNYLIKWKSELGLMHFYKRRYKESKKLYVEVDKLLNESNEVDEKTKFLHYYRYGVLQNNTNHPSLAEKLFEKSFEYADTNFYKGNAIMNIGISFVRRKKYRKAIEYYRKALGIFDDDLSRSILFNNLAEIYRSLEEYDKALYYIKLAFSCTDDENLSDMFVCYQTYAQILMCKDEVGEAIKKLMELINKAENKFVYKKFIMAGINIIKEYVLKTKSINILEDMEELIYQSVNNASSHDKEYIKELKSYIELNMIYKKYLNPD